MGQVVTFRPRRIERAVQLLAAIEGLRETLGSMDGTASAAAEAAADGEIQEESVRAFERAERLIALAGVELLQVVLKKEEGAVG
jgi:hypothetical protein